MDKNIHIIETTHGLYANLEQIIALVRDTHKAYPTLSTTGLLFALTEGERRYREQLSYLESGDYIRRVGCDDSDCCECSDPCHD